jgi:hypothetical protein
MDVENLLDDGIRVSVRRMLGLGQRTFHLRIRLHILLRLVGIEGVPTVPHHRTEQFPIKSFVGSKLKPGLPIIHKLDPRVIIRGAPLTNAASIPGIGLGLIIAGKGKELLRMIGMPPRPVPGALFEVNRAFVS